MADKNGDNGDRNGRVERLAGAARELRAGTSIPPGSEQTDDVVARIEKRQVQVVEAIGEALLTVSEVVGELQVSVEEEALVREQMGLLVTETSKLRRLVRATSYVTMLSTTIAATIVVFATIWQVRILHYAAEDVGRVAATLKSVEANTSIATDVLLKQAEVKVKETEAEVAPSPHVEKAALEAAIDLQENAAQAQLAVAANRQAVPPPAATKALREAREKRARLRQGPTIPQTDRSDGTPLPSGDPLSSRVPAPSVEP